MHDKCTFIAHGGMDCLNPRTAGPGVSVLPLDGPVAGSFQMPDNCVIRHLWRPRSCCLNPFPSPVMLQARPSPEDQVRLAARARNTQRAYLGHWTRFHSWAQEQGLDLPGGLEAALCDYLVRLAEDGKRMATIRQARAAIIRGADLAGWPKPGGRRRGDDAGAGPDPPGAPETGGAPPRRGPGGDQGHRLHPPPHPGRSYRDGEIRPAPRPGRRRPGLRHARRAAAGLRGRRPALGGRGAGRRRQRPHPDSGVEDRPGGRGGGVVPGTGRRPSPAGHPPGRGGDRRGHLRSSTSTQTPSGGVCSRQRGRLGSPAGGTSPDTPGGLGWPRTCRLRASPSPS